MPANVTPMMRQYLEMKEKYKDCLLFFRLGDFYEMFFEDAITASRELEIVLTGRDCGLEERAPMCGVPYHSVDSYINKLISKGYKVAICEQLTDPSLKGLVERDVIRIITPGTVIEDSMLSERKNNYIVSLYYGGSNANNGIGIAYSDVSTGDFFVTEFKDNDKSLKVIEELARIQPNEIIANEGIFSLNTLINNIKSSYYIEKYDNRMFDLKKSNESLIAHFEVASLSGFGCENMDFAVCAAGGLLSYLEETQKNSLMHIKKISVIHNDEFMSIDVSTRRNLELTKPLRFDGSKKNTLLDLLDRTKTAMGGRLLRVWIEQPLQKVELINNRLNSVEELYDKPIDRQNIAEKLNSIYDIERLCSKIAYGTVNARDCVSLMMSLEKLPGLVECLKELKNSFFKQFVDNIDLMEDIYSLLISAIADNPPSGVKDGGIIKDGYNEKVDEYRRASQNSRQWLSELEAKEKQKTGIKNLKIGYNKVFGYYIEVTKSYQGLVPYEYQRKQTLANAERYITEELKNLEEMITGAEEKCVALEYKLFSDIREMLSGCIERLKNDAALIAELDVYQALSEVAIHNKYIKPEICETGEIEIIDGRHPVVERMLKDKFIPNNTLLNNDKNRIMVLTGPNMAGKSTYMRQIALMVLMAHIGSFVPAKYARICVVDRIFTRVGASDNLASGQSTFMVEMSEMANILNNATRNSLLIIDEIGRGTSTFDGLSIAWSVIEHIADKKKCGAKTLFATHYHELTELEGKIQGIKNYRISVKEIGDDIIFLRKIVEGGADKSFGIQVAKLAGLPNGVIKRAKQILKELENSDLNKRTNSVEMNDELLVKTESDDEIIEEIRNMNVNAVTPIEAITILYDLQNRVIMRTKKK